MLGQQVRRLVSVVHRRHAAVALQMRQMRRDMLQSLVSLLGRMQCVLSQVLLLLLLMPVGLSLLLQLLLVLVLEHHLLLHVQRQLLLMLMRLLSVDRRLRDRGTNVRSRAVLEELVCTGRLRDTVAAVLGSTQPRRQLVLVLRGIVVRLRGVMYRCMCVCLMVLTLVTLRHRRCRCRALSLSAAAVAPRTDGD